MAESWVRLWAGMTTDPKWQTVARKSGQPRALVIALFTHLMLEANEAEERGSVMEIDVEDVASALDCDEQAVSDILHAMEGRVIQHGRLTGWDRRQPAREDAGNPETGALSAAERKRRQRERERTSRDVTHGHDASRDVTHGHAPEAEADTEAEVNQPPTSSVVGTPTAIAREEAPTAALPAAASNPIPDPEPTRRGIVCRLLRQAGISDAAPHHLTDETWDALLAKRTDEEIVEFARAKLGTRQGQRTGLKYLAPGLLEDPHPITGPPSRASPRMSARDAGRLAAARTIFGTGIEVQDYGNDNARTIDAAPAVAGALDAKDLR